MTTVTIYTDNTISVGATITGYRVEQTREGTVVRRTLNNGRPVPRDLGDVVAMSKPRYVLASQADRDQFDSDFLAAWAAAA